MATAAAIDITERIEDAKQRTKATLKALKRHRGLSDREIGERIEWERGKVWTYISGPTAVTTEALSALSYALRVPDHVLLMEPDDAVRWVLDNPGPDGPDDPSEQANSASLCLSDELAHRRAARRTTLAPLPLHKAS